MVNARLSFRGFTSRAGLRSPNYLKLVIDGDRYLTVAMAKRFAAACGLEGEPAEYFCSLVAFEQADAIEIRGQHYERLKRFAAFRKIHHLDLAQAEYYAQWYYPAIRELASRHDCYDDPEWIAAKLTPSIRAEDARTAVDNLLSMGLLRRDETGRLKQVDALVSTERETRSFHVANYHRTMIAQAAHSLDRIKPQQRDISSVTLCLGKDGLSLVKKRIQEMRRELLQLAELEPDPEQVVQVNFQLFPLSIPDDE
jgi:uncharacterized protein (TIGR02147 family)